MLVLYYEEGVGDGFLFILHSFKKIYFFFGEVHKIIYNPTPLFFYYITFNKIIIEYNIKIGKKERCRVVSFSRRNPTPTLHQPYTSLIFILLLLIK